MILASGGFGANPDMVARYAPNLADLTTDNAPGNTGEMMVKGSTDRRSASRHVRDPMSSGLSEGTDSPRAASHGRVPIHHGQSRRKAFYVREDGRRDDLRDAVLRALPERFAYSIVDNPGMESHNILVQKETVIGVETGDAFRADSLRRTCPKNRRTRGRLDRERGNLQSRRCNETRSVPGAIP